MENGKSLNFKAISKVCAAYLSYEVCDNELTIWSTFKLYNNHLKNITMETECSKHDFFILINMKKSCLLSVNIGHSIGLETDVRACLGS